MVFWGLLAWIEDEIFPSRLRGVAHQPRRSSELSAHAELERRDGLTRWDQAQIPLQLVAQIVANQRDQALTLYTSLSAPNVPRPVRHGAMQAIIREETSINRPR